MLGWRSLLMIVLAFSGQISGNSTYAQTDSEIAALAARALADGASSEKKLTEFALRDLSSGDTRKLEWWYTRLMARSKVVEAAPFAQRQLELAERQYGPDHPEVAKALHRLSLYPLTQGRYTEAEALSERALRIREKVSGPESPDLLEYLDQLVRVYRARGRNDDAEGLKKRALAIREKTGAKSNSK
jgi:tetratricopeptide (TPR) repeat protein